MISLRAFGTPNDLINLGSQLYTTWLTTIVWRHHCLDMIEVAEVTYSNAAFIPMYRCAVLKQTR